jgi:ATP-dependent exoDNAse (exonuclease V) alpha subunit
MDDPANPGIQLRRLHHVSEPHYAHRIPRQRRHHPQTGEQLVRQRAAYEYKDAEGKTVKTMEHRAGWDATFTGVSVYREIDRDFSVGDRIQFTAPDKSLGVANRDLAAIESLAPDGRISARLDSNRQVEFNAAKHRHFDHGYAVTSHSSQGLTAERVLVNADTGVHPDLLNSRFGYVSISRASHEATLFTDDMTKLSPQLSADVSKTSALEISQALPATQGIGIAIGI